MGKKAEKEKRENIVYDRLVFGAAGRGYRNEFLQESQQTDDRQKVQRLFAVALSYKGKDDRYQGDEGSTCQKITHKTIT